MKDFGGLNLYFNFPLVLIIVSSHLFYSFKKNCNKLVH